MELVKGGIFVEQDRKHMQKFVELTDVSKMMGKSTPCPANPHKCGDKSERCLRGDGADNISAAKQGAARKRLAAEVGRLSPIPRQACRPWHQMTGGS